MSDDAEFAADALPALYAEFGLAGSIQRGADAAVDVQLIVDRDNQRLGEFAVSVIRATTVSVQCAQWPQLQRDDVVAWTDRLGQHSKRVDTQLSNDGLECKAVLHG